MFQAVESRWEGGIRGGVDYETRDQLEARMNAVLITWRMAKYPRTLIFLTTKQGGSYRVSAKTYDSTDITAHYISKISTPLPQRRVSRSIVISFVISLQILKHVQAVHDIWLLEFTYMKIVEF